MTITRRAALGGLASLSTAAAATIAITTQEPAAPPETPEERYARTQREFIEASKALWPEVTDWRTVRDADDFREGKSVGLFMIIGHRDEKWGRA